MKEGVREIECKKIKNKKNASCPCGESRIQGKGIRLCGVFGELQEKSYIWNGELVWVEEGDSCVVTYKDVIKTVFISVWRSHQHQGHFGIFRHLSF